MTRQKRTFQQLESDTIETNECAANDSTALGNDPANDSGSGNAGGAASMVRSALLTKRKFGSEGENHIVDDDDESAPFASRSGSKRKRTVPQCCLKSVISSIVSRLEDVVTSTGGPVVVQRLEFLNFLVNNRVLCEFEFEVAAMQTLEFLSDLLHIDENGFVHCSGAAPSKFNHTAVVPADREPVLFLEVMESVANALVGHAPFIEPIDVVLRFLSSVGRVIVRFEPTDLLGHLCSLGIVVVRSEDELWLNLPPR
jgi:hypothetical protein